VHSISPRSFADVVPAMVTLGETVGAGVPAWFAEGEWDTWLAEQAAAPERARAAVLVWRRPWMTVNADTYGSSLLDAIGIDNVFAGDEDRYPEVTMETISARLPDMVLLPSEPYVFKDRHVDEVAAALPGVRARLVDGRDLFWWGIRTPDALSRLRETLFRASGGPA
jgi:hypothetical protein